MILDDDSITVSVDNTVLWGGWSNVQVRLSRALPVPLEVGILAVEGTASNGSDFAFPSSVVTIPAGALMRMMLVYTYPPEAGEEAEQFLIRTAPSQGRAGPDAVMTISAASPRLSVADSWVVLEEGHGGTRAVVVSYQLSGPAPAGASFEWITRDGTALAGSDFPMTTGSVTVTEGSLLGTFEVLINGDVEGEWDEDFTVVLTNPTHLYLAGSDSAQITVLNDDTGLPRGETFTTSQGTMLQGTDVRQNDTGVTQVTIVEPMAYGTGSLYSTGPLAGTFIYTPLPNFIGQDRFTYRDSFRNAAVDPLVATVFIQVTDAQLPPFIKDDSFTTTEDVVLDQTEARPDGPFLLLNDGVLNAVGQAYDPILEISYADVTGGALSDHLGVKGRFKFTPLPDFGGVGGFSYRLRDKDGWSAPAQVKITVRDDLPLGPMERLSPVGSQLHRRTAASVAFQTGKITDAVLDLVAGQTVSLRAELVAGQPFGLGRLELVNAGGQLITGGIAGEGSLEHIPVPADGRYKLLAGNPVSNSNARFTVLINGGLPRSIASNPSVAYALDAARPAGSNRAAVAARFLGGLPQYYRFDAVAGEPVELFLQSGAVQRFTLLTAAGSVLGNSAPGVSTAKSAQLRFTPAVTETLFVAVTGVSGTGGAEYTLQLHRPGNTHEYASATPTPLVRRNTGFLRGRGMATPGPPEAALTFAAFADYGSGSANEAAVADMVKSWNPDFIIAAGDHNYLLDYKIGTPTWKTTVGDFYGGYIKGRSDNFYPEQTSPVQRFFPVPGNHDSGPDPSNGGELSSYLDYFHVNPGGNPRLPGGVHQARLSYYAMTWGNAEFFFLDSDNAAVDSAASTQQRQWLKMGINQSTARWKFGIWHHPPFSSSLHGNHGFIQWGADFRGLTAIICGHDHIFERLNIGQDVTQFTVGIGGNSFYTIGSQIAQGSQFRHNASHGALKVIAGTDGVQFDFCAAGPGGGTIMDSWTVGTPPSLVTSSGADTWSWTVQPGENLRVRTRTPGAPGGLVNGLDPRVEVRDATGVLVAASADGASDGKNVSLDFTVPPLPGVPSEGVVWTVKVINEAPGEGEYEILTSPSPLPLYDAWALANLPNFPVLPQDDPDYDGAPNLMEFLMDSDPKIPSTASPIMPSLTAAGAGAAAVQIRINLPPDWTRPVAVTLQSSTSLTDSPWTSLATKSAGGAWIAAVPGTALPLADPGGGFVFNAPPDGRRFYRLAFVVGE